MKQFEKVEDSEVEKFCKNVIKNNAKAVEDYKNGEEKALNFLIGQVMKESKRKADFNTAKSILLKLLK